MTNVRTPASFDAANKPIIPLPGSRSTRLLFPVSSPFTWLPSAARARPASTGQRERQLQVDLSVCSPLNYRAALIISNYRIRGTISVIEYFATRFSLSSYKPITSNYYVVITWRWHRGERERERDIALLLLYYNMGHTSRNEHRNEHDRLVDIIIRSVNNPSIDRPTWSNNRCYFYYEQCLINFTLSHHRESLLNSNITVQVETIIIINDANNTYKILYDLYLWF